MKPDQGEALGGEERRARHVLLDVAMLERAFEDTTNEARRHLDVVTGTISALHHGMTSSPIGTLKEI